jgi:uncharacterized repeat protein (TIGR04076 family)
MNYLQVYLDSTVEVISVSGKCNWLHSIGQQFSDNTKTAGGICPYLYHNMIPYALTFNKGGYFKWRTDRKSVEILCPNPREKVNTLLSHDGFGKMSCHVLSAGEGCCAEYKIGTILPIDSTTGLCPLAFAVLFPVLLGCLEETDGEAEVCCPSTQGKVLFRVRRTSQ